ncbi:hypothetical protein [Pandoraea sp. E26]|uniref:hypothetical protein n=1 Tax=Pandoraea sp. E26 TaxID=1427365 RepID=UPI00048AFEB8|nr:hypothetical protein [Pandoraea sp. E26]
MINSEVTDDFISASLSRSNGDANSDSTFQNNSDINASNTAVIVSERTITLTNGANQTQDLASLNRDTSNLNETVNRTPDLQNLLNDQSRLMAAATAAGEAVARDIGTYADKKREAALKMADATTDPELKAQYQKEADDWKEGGDYRAAMHAAGGAIIAGFGGGNALGGALGAGLTSKLGGTLNELSESIQKAHPTGNADIDQALAQIVATGVGTAVGAAVGGSSGAFAGYNVDRFNRQLHPEEKALAKRISDDAKARALKNTDGSPITAEQIEDMLRSAANSHYRETITTGMVVPLNGSTTVGRLYDTAGMRVTNDGAGNYYLVQDSSMFASPSDALRNLIQQSTGGPTSPYSWNVRSPEAAQAGSAQTLSTSPFAQGWNTGENSAGIQNSDPRNTPTIGFQAGFHLPISPGVSIGPNVSYTANDGVMSIKPDVSLGTIYDIGMSVGFSGDLKYSGPSVVNFGLGRYLGVQITPSNSLAWAEKSWIAPGKYFNGISFGIGVGVSSPVNVTLDPTY